MPSNDLEEADGEEQSSPSLLNDELRQEMRARQAKMHRYWPLHHAVLCISAASSRSKPCGCHSHDWHLLADGHRAIWRSIKLLIDYWLLTTLMPRKVFSFLFFSLYFSSNGQLLNKLTPKGVVFSFLFFSFLFLKLVLDE